MEKTKQSQGELYAMEIHMKTNQKFTFWEKLSWGKFFKCALLTELKKKVPEQSN